MANYEQVSYSTRIRYPLLAADANPIAHAESLLKHYSFDLGGRSVQELLSHWQTHYAPQWIRLAVIEALYQGRYKAISVDEILKIWRRRRHPTPHFSGEFERLVGDRFPRNLLSTEQRKALPRRLQPDDSAWMNLARQTLEWNGEQSKARSNQLAPSSQKLSDSQTLSDSLDGSEALSNGLSDPVSDALPSNCSDNQNWDNPLTKNKLSENNPERASVLLSQSVNSSIAQSPVQTVVTDGDVFSSLDADLDLAIHQFVPTDISPEFCNKLKAVANEHLSPLARSLNDAEEDGLEPTQVAAMSSDAEALLVQSSEHGMNHSNDHPNTHHLSDLVAHDSENHNVVMNHLENAEPGLIDRIVSPNTAHSL